MTSRDKLLVQHKRWNKSFRLFRSKALLFRSKARLSVGALHAMGVNP